MKNSIYKIILLCVTTILFTNCSNNDNNASRSAEQILVTIDNGTPVDYSYNILAKDFPLAASSGFNCMFVFTSENVSGTAFSINFGQQTANCPFVITTPYTNTFTGPVSNFITIPGINFDDAAANSLTMSISNFGANTGDDIDITITGTYYELLDPTPHNLSISIHVHRD